MASGERARRRYSAPAREAAAARTRGAVAASAADLFGRIGWSGTTMRGVAEAAGVSLKTVEALHGTKAALLESAVDFAIRGDTAPVAMPRRPAVAAMERAADAPRMLELHAAHIRTVNARSAAIAFAVETAAPADEAVAGLWQRMDANRAYAVSWAANLLLSKPGRRRGLVRSDVESTFWVAIDWGTYRTLTGSAGLTDDGFERWLRRLYRGAFL